MRQSMEAEPMTQPDHNDIDVSLAQILTEVVEEVRLSIDRDINGADLLHSLLSAPWLYSILRVYEGLMQYRRDAPIPHLPYSSRLSQEILSSVQRLATPSPHAQELEVLLRNPHMQALLSAHDYVAQRDYGPVLPPLPDELPADEEVMRIVCLVKNKQPLCIGEEKPSRWQSLRRLTVEKSALASRLGSGHLHVSAGGLSSSTGLLSSTPPAHPCSLPRYQSTGTCKLSGEGLNQSTPAVYGSVIMDNCTNGIETIIKDQHCRGNQSKTRAITHSSLVYPQICCPPGCGLHSPPAHSSPLVHRHKDANHSTYPSLLSTKQQRLDELKSTIHTVACNMEQSSSDVKELRQNITSVTEKMTDSIKENAQALNLLVEGVDKLQGLVKSRHVAYAHRPQSISKTASVSNSPSQVKMPAKTFFYSSSATRPHILSSSSTTSSSSSTSLSSCMDVLQTTSKSSHKSSSSQTLGSKTGKTSLSKILMVSRPNDKK